MSTTEFQTPLARAIKVAGGISAMARTLKLSGHAVIQQWRINQVPAEHCPDIEALTGIKCEELRPDVNWAVLRKPFHAQIAPNSEVQGVSVDHPVNHGLPLAGGLAVCQPTAKGVANV